MCSSRFIAGRRFSMPGADSGVKKFALRRQTGNVAKLVATGVADEQGRARAVDPWRHRKLVAAKMEGEVRRGLSRPGGAPVARGKLQFRGDRIRGGLEAGAGGARGVCQPQSNF